MKKTIVPLILLAMTACNPTPHQSVRMHKSETQPVQPAQPESDTLSLRQQVEGEKPMAWYQFTPNEQILIASGAATVAAAGAGYYYRQEIKSIKPVDAVRRMIDGMFKSGAPAEEAKQGLSAKALEVIASGNRTALAALKRSGEFVATAKNRMGINYLMVALRKRPKDTELVKDLVNAGVNPNDKAYNMDSLEYAISEGNAKDIELFISLKTVRNSKISFETLRDIVISKSLNQEQKISILSVASNGANLQEIHASGATLIWPATYNGLDKVVQFLAERGVSATTTVDGRTLLMELVQEPTIGEELKDPKAIAEQRAKLIKQHLMLPDVNADYLAVRSQNRSAYVLAEMTKAAMNDGRTDADIIAEVMIDHHQMAPRVLGEEIRIVEELKVQAAQRIK